MKINSNTIKLEEQDYKNLESVITKIASENKIEDVAEIDISITADEGIVKFKKALGESLPLSVREPLEITGTPGDFPASIGMIHLLGALRNLLIDLLNDDEISAKAYQEIGDKLSAIDAQFDIAYKTEVNLKKGELK